MLMNTMSAIGNLVSMCGRALLLVAEFSEPVVLLASKMLYVPTMLPNPCPSITSASLTSSISWKVSPIIFGVVSGCLARVVRQEIVVVIAVKIVGALELSGETTKAASLSSFESQWITLRVQQCPHSARDASPLVVKY